MRLSSFTNLHNQQMALMAEEQDFDHSADFVKKIKLYGNNDNSLVNPAKS